MASIGKGTKVKYTLNVTGLGEKKLSDNDVDFKIDFFAREKSSNPITSYCTVRKAAATKDDSAGNDGNTYFVICDTANLDLGALYGTLKVTYTDDDTQAELVEITSINTTERIIEAPASPETEPEHEPTPSEEPNPSEEPSQEDNTQEGE